MPRTIAPLIEDCLAQHGVGIQKRRRARQARRALQLP